jgi:tetratricopeptide (TPR) repeat protein
MTGDGIMALFGAPVALEDAPQRAIRAALAIHREMVRFNDKMKQERPGLPTLKMRIGIHTGPVVVGTLGNDLRVEFKAVGDTVNLASRMEGLAEPGTTYVSGETFKLTEGLFRFEGLGEKEVKGKAEPVSVYRVIAPSTRRTRFDVAAERGLTPFVGRQPELELLHDALDRAKDGQGQAVSIVAPAGDGKSRTLYEFRKDVVNEDVTFLEGKCLSYSRGVPYHPVIDILKGSFDIRDGDRDEAVRDKVQRGLEVLGADDAATTPYLLELLSVQDSGIDLTLSREARKDRTIQALKRIVLKGSQIRPLVLSVEDLHWIDRSSEDVFQDLLEHIAGVRVLLLFTYRTEYVHAWRARSYHSQVNLNRLSNRETLAMARHLLGTEAISAGLENLILGKTEGVPFFVEEFLKSLRELEIIEREDNTSVLAKGAQQGAIPSTIQDVLMARADALPAGAKEVLQIGSVIEREFSHELLETVTGLPERELLSHLSALKDAELLYERGVYPLTTYIFKHALTREVIYDSMLSRRRKRLHQTVGESMEQLYRDRLHEYYEVLCEHFMAGEDYAKGTEYSRLAHKAARKTGSFWDAIAYSNKTLKCLRSLPRTRKVDEDIVDAQTSIGLYYIQLNRHVEAKEGVESIVRLAKERGLNRRLSQIYAILGSYDYLVEGDLQKSFGHLTMALDLANETDDRLSLAMANYWIGLAFSYDCKFEKAKRYMENTLKINEMINTKYPIAMTKSMLTQFVYNPQGRIDLGCQTSAQALKLADDSDDIYSGFTPNTAFGASCYHKGLLDQAESHLHVAVDYSQKMEEFVYVGFAEHSLGDVFFEKGQYERSLKHHSNAEIFFRRSRINQAFIILSQLGMARTQAKIEGTELDLDALLDSLSAITLPLFFNWSLAYIAEIFLELGKTHNLEVAEWIKKAIEAHQTSGMMWYLAKDYTMFAELLARNGNRSGAREQFHKAIGIFHECGADGWVKRTEEKLAQL